MKSFSELTSASYVSNSDILAISQENSGTYSSKKTTVKEVSDFANQNFAEEYDSTSSYAVGDYCIYESVLYKCTASTTGSFDNTKWTSVVVTDEMGSGGGGGAGHTIKDDGGNALTQRSNLQFKGVYSHDDPTNSASVVEVARSMTWAEYQLLSADEKKGLITITDRFTADAMFVNGVFIDTDNIIQSSTSISTSADTTYTATEDCILRYEIYSTSSLNGYLKVDNNWIIETAGSVYVANVIYVKKGQTVTMRSQGSAGSYIVYGIQQGTNPSIPDYSTTEHKTGRKWIDGKDIWEKTVAVTTNNSNPFVLATNVSTLISSKGCIGDYSIPAPYFDSNRSYISVLFAQTAHEVRVYSLGSNYNNLTGYVTVEYTKSS